MYRPNLAPPVYPYRTLTVIGNQSLNVPQEIFTENIIYHNCVNVKVPENYFPKQPIIHSKKVFLDLCDKNFVKFTLNKDYFPRLEEVYLKSLPHSPLLFKQFYYEGEGKRVYVYLHEDYGKYKNIWAKDIYNVVLISEIRYINLLNYTRQTASKMIIGTNHGFYN